MLSQEEFLRYSRHIKLSNVGEQGQLKLKQAKVLVIGAGGLGCPVLQYLTAAGVGIIGLIDDDTVEVSNLQRQILFNTEDVGTLKVHAAVAHLSAQNPEISFHAHAERLSTENAVALFQGYDIIVDGTDNFPTRYLVNDACIITGKPLVFGSIYQFEGQVSVFNHAEGPSYRCLYPSPPAPGEVPNCSEVGVIGVLPGVIGTRMATECIKIILNLGTTLSGVLLVTNLLNNTELQVRIKRNEENFSRTELEENYEGFCGIESSEVSESNSQEITPIELKKLLESERKVQLVDVREGFEFEICRISNSKHIPLGQLAKRYREIDPEMETILICHHGIRSRHALEYLEKYGYTKLKNLLGGIHLWAEEVDFDMPKY